MFYVFYEQYSTIIYDASTQITLSLAVVYAVTCVLLGLDPVSAFITGTFSTLAFLLHILIFTIYVSFLVLIIVCILVDMLGLMVLWNIDLNAISVANLVMVSCFFLLSNDTESSYPHLISTFFQSLGISVEFIVHIIRMFTHSVRRTRIERAEEALAQMGSTVRIRFRFHFCIIHSFISSRLRCSRESH